MEFFDYDDTFQPMDDPSCQDLDGMISSLLIRLVVWFGVELMYLDTRLSLLLQIIFLFLICLRDMQGVRMAMSTHGPPLLLIADLAFTSSRTW
jgi:hypothetical protein